MSSLSMAEKSGLKDLEHLAEELPEVRTSEACAFSVLDPNGIEMTAMVVQWREGNSTRGRRICPSLAGADPRALRDRLFH